MTVTVCGNEIESRTPAKQAAIDAPIYRSQLDYLFRASAFYRRKLKDAGFADAKAAGDLSDIAWLPFSEKEEIRKSKAAASVRRASGSAPRRYAFLTFAGCTFEHKILIANSWTPHLLVADSYGRKRVMLAGDAVHQYVPIGGYGMNTGIADAFDLRWKLAAVLKGFVGSAVLDSYEIERRPVGVRNCVASDRRNEVRVAISRLYRPSLRGSGATADAERSAVSKAIAVLGNSENESMGIELGCYANSPIVCCEHGASIPNYPVRYEPTIVPGACLSSVFLKDGVALYDRLGPWSTLLVFRGQNAGAFERAAAERGLPLNVLRLDEPEIAPIYQANASLGPAGSSCGLARICAR